MSNNKNGSGGYGKAIEDVTAELCNPSSYEGVYHRPQHEQPMPSLSALEEVMDRLKAVLFPGYFGNSEVTPETMRFHVGANLDAVCRLLSEQTKRGFCFVCPREEQMRTCTECEERSIAISREFIGRLPEIRRLLATDVDAAFRGDPAAKSPGETIFCYPSIIALTHYRVAHALHGLGVTVIPRIITEMASTSIPAPTSARTSSSTTAPAWSSARPASLDAAFASTRASPWAPRASRKTRWACWSRASRAIPWSRTRSPSTPARPSSAA